jgi:tight adherence protein C
VNDLHWLAIAAPVAMGASFAGLAYWLVSAIGAVPPEDRSYRDAPPTAFRLFWWPIRWIAHYLAPLVPASAQQRALAKLRLAGLDYAISPQQLLAGRLVLASASAMALWWLMPSFHADADAWPLLAFAAGYVFPGIWLRDKIQLRSRETLKTLPFFLDIVTLCVEAGLNLNGALAQAADKGPKGPLRDEIQRILRDMRAGKSRADALRTFADRMNEPSISNLVSALIQSESSGMNLGPVLRAQAEQRRSERFARAEKLAMEAPVKLLLPLIAFIFPCTFVVLGFPIAMKFIQMGL